jgi:Fur family ferric uptake transcriptional regulator
VAADVLAVLRRDHEFEVDLGHLAVFGHCTTCPPVEPEPPVEPVETKENTS